MFETTEELAAFDELLFAASMFTCAFNRDRFEALLDGAALDDARR
jgi:hypothetical protein